MTSLTRRSFGLAALSTPAILTATTLPALADGHAKGAPLQECLEPGPIAAAEVISHYGPRPQAHIKSLLSDQL